MINKKIWNINLPVLKGAFVTNISPKQYDTASNLFKISLYKDMEKYDLTGLSVQAVFKKADGTISYLPCTITNAASGELEVDVTSQVLAIAAEVECEIRVTGTEGELLIAPKFYFKVYESLNIDGAVESQDEFPVLVELLNRVETVESDLQNITPEQIAQVTTNEQTRQNQEAARQAAEAERAGFYAGFNAQLADKVQNFKLKNEVVNGDFSQGTTGWITGNVAFSVANNEAVFLASATVGHLRQPMTTVKDRKYYVRSKIKSTSNQVAMVVINSSAPCNTPLIPLYHSGSGLYEDKSGVYTIPDVVTSYNLRFVDYRSSNFDNVNVKNILRIDLTATFGAGNEPTKEEMDRLVSMVPNQWWDGELDLTQQQYVNWLLSFIREKANKAQEDWLTPTLQNGALGVSGYTVQYRKNSLGYVEFRGRIDTTSLPIGSQALTLPVNYRPLVNRAYLCLKGTVNEVGRITVFTDGRLTGTSYTQGQILVLDGIVFPTDK